MAAAFVMVLVLPDERTTTFFGLFVVDRFAAFMKCLVLVGAAANSVHPLVAQGFNLALRDVAALSETLATFGRPPADPGDPALLARYASWRRSDQAYVVRFTDGLARLSRSAWLRPLRGLGLQAFDVLPQARPMLARFALGQGGRMSRLARGLPL